MKKFYKISLLYLIFALQMFPAATNAKTINTTYDTEYLTDYNYDEESDSYDEIEETALNTDDYDEIVAEGDTYFLCK